MDGSSLISLHSITLLTPSMIALDIPRCTTNCHAGILNRLWLDSRYEWVLAGGHRKLHHYQRPGYWVPVRFLCNSYFVRATPSLRQAKTNSLFFTNYLFFTNARVPGLGPPVVDGGRCRIFVVVVQFQRLCMRCTQAGLFSNYLWDHLVWVIFSLNISCWGFRVLGVQRPTAVTCCLFWQYAQYNKRVHCSFS